MELNHKIIVLGSGVVKNSWDPIINVIKNYYDYPIDKEKAYLHMVKMVYFMRYQTAKNRIEEPLKLFNKFIDELIESINEYEELNLFTLQDDFEENIFKHFIDKDSRLFIIDANWDNTAINKIKELINKNEINQNSFLKIHGQALTSKSLYLPSEICDERYRDTNSNHSGQHAKAVKHLVDCNELILYGLSLDPLDYELSFTLSMSAHYNNLRKVTIIDKKPNIVKERFQINFEKGKKLPIFKSIEV